ncbi:hypothetical protein NW767_014452 [Fusarium falciforme]|nr:hypothetical protein NW767_014452 [Fusarium falciforme]
MSVFSSSLRRSFLCQGTAVRPLGQGPRLLPLRGRGLASVAPGNRSQGSIGDAFASLSKKEIELPRRFGQLKNQLIGDSGRAILDSWVRLLQHVEKETIPSVNELSSSIIPEVEFSSIVENGGQLPDRSKALLKERGTIVIRGLVSEK